MAVPRIKDKSYHKALIECWANLGVDIFNGTSYVKSFSGGIIPKHNIPVKLFIIMKALSHLVQYIVNSASWRNGETEAFDIEEISRKIQSLK